MGELPVLDDPEVIIAALDWFLPLVQKPTTETD